jgi:hypothetical protein
MSARLPTVYAVTIAVIDNLIQTRVSGAFQRRTVRYADCGEAVTAPALSSIA